jgi:streptogrisin B
VHKNATEELNATKELTFGPGTFDELKKDPNFIAAYGSIPTFSTSDERKQWLSNLDKIYTKANKKYDKEMSKYFDPNGSVIGYGYTIDGVIQVTIKKGHKISTDKENAIYKLFSNYGQEINITDTPVVFVYGDVFIPASRASYWRPLIGGLQIISDGNGQAGMSTLGFAAKTSSGTKGFIVSEHAAPFIGSGVYQPTASSANYIECVAKHSNTFADASWVPNSNVRAMIYEYDTDHTRNVVSYQNRPDVGDLVYKSGITTGETGGYVTQIGTTRDDAGVGRTLYEQCIAHFRCDLGDSGSPVYYRLYNPNNVEIVGIFWGKDSTGTYGAFSPVSGIHNDLGVYPLKV